MKLILAALLLILALVYLPTSSAIGYSHCGSRLVDVLFMVCGSRRSSYMHRRLMQKYPGLRGRGRRALAAADETAIVNHHHSSKTILSELISIGHHMHQRHQRRARRRRNIVEQCCRRSCTYATMRRYC